MTAASAGDNHPELQGIHVLLAEDRTSLRQMLTDFLSGKGCLVEPVASVHECLTSFRTRRFDLVLADLRLPDGSGMDVLRAIRQEAATQPVILMTAYGSIEETVQAMKLGAVDFIQKPLDLDRLHALIVQVCEARLRESQNILFREEYRRLHGLPCILSVSPAMDMVARQVQRVSSVDATVLLMGESGTGKELFARALHLLSPRREGPFVEVNCAAIPETLMENELFGHVRGAYTGAESTVRGKFALASGGTLFLDEIGEMPAAVQPKLLKALEEKRVTPIGGVSAEQVDVRIVAATNRDLEAECAAGRFRRDLYYRLAQFPVHIPPLRSHPEDIEPLAEHFVREAAARYGLPAPALGPEARSMLRGHLWPGNVRELRNLCERAVVVTEGGVIRSADLFGTSLPAAGQVDVVLLPELLELGLEEWTRRRTDRQEKAALEAAMEALGPVREHVARALGISAKTLTAKLRRHQMIRTSSEEGPCD